MKLVASARKPFPRNVLAHFKKMVNVLFVAFVALGSPLEPQLEDVIVSTALDHLVARIIAHIVVLVLLKQVICTHLVRLNKETLQRKMRTC